MENKVAPQQDASSLVRLEYGHKVSCVVPEEVYLSNTSQVISVDLSWNGIPWVPVQFFKHFRAEAAPLLTSLLLGTNLLCTLPDELALLVNLRDLDLSGNKLDVVPEAIAKLTNLVCLNLSLNKICHLPSRLCHGLQHLEKLILSGNHITTLPDELHMFPKLMHLDLSFNRFGFIPRGLQHLTSLTKLSMSDNQISSPDIHSEIWKALIALEYFDLSNNALHAVPEHIGHFPNLKHLSLRNNQLHNVCEQFCHLRQVSSLVSLDLSHNRMTEVTAKMCSGLVNLKSLDLSDNNISSLPNECGLFPRLQSLDVSHNALTELPSSIIQLSSLTELTVRYNLICLFPGDMGNTLPRLESLKMDHNPLSSLLGEMTVFPKLHTLHMEETSKDYWFLQYLGYFPALKNLRLTSEGFGATSRKAVCTLTELFADKKTIQEQPSLGKTSEVNGSGDLQNESKQLGQLTLSHSNLDASATPSATQEE